MSARPTQAAIEAAPVTDGFQLEFGPDGACRIVVLGTAASPEAVVAVLELDAAAADALTEQMVGRRAAYEQYRQGGRNH